MEFMDKNGEKKFQKSYFDVLGLCCSSEVPLIEKILNSLDGVKDFSVLVPTKTVIVVHDSLIISQIQIVKALNQARLEANIRAYGEQSYKNKWPSPYAVICGLLLLLSFLKYFYSPLRWLAVGAVAVGILPISLKAVAALQNLTIEINILVLIAGLSWYNGKCQIHEPIGHGFNSCRRSKNWKQTLYSRVEVSGSIALHDYWEAGTIVFLFAIAEWLESRATHKAAAVMTSLVTVVPQRAVLADTGEEVNADEVKLNTILVVKAGEVIPIDGVVVEGKCEVDEKFLTGESFPVAKQQESTVWASTINLNGYITVKTTAVAEDCVVARMAKLVEDAQNKKSKTQRIIDKCAKYYTPAIVVLSASLALVPVAFQVHNKNEWYHLSLVVLVSGCPCPLLLSTPVAMFCALSKAAKLRVLVKGAEHLETLARIKIMAFDKTGTITRGEFLVANFKSLQNDISFNTLLYWISSIESKSSHPMAAALADFARAHAIEPKPEKVERFEIFPGEGIFGRIEDNDIYVGNGRIASRAGCPTGEQLGSFNIQTSTSRSFPGMEGYDIEGKSVGYVFLGSSLAGIFCLSDECRTGAKEALNELKSMGLKTVMLTGDCYAAAKHAQDQLGGALEVVHPELLPQDKERIIKELQKQGPTAMIGDGVNDAPALAKADIGIAMGVSGSALATESGDIVLMSNDIQGIVKACCVAKNVRRKIIENVIISIVTKAAIVGLAIAGHPLVWAAVLADVGTCLLVIFNSMLILGRVSGHGKGRKCCRPSSHRHSHKHVKCDVTSSGCSSTTYVSECCSSVKEASRDSHCHSHDGGKECCDEFGPDVESQTGHGRGSEKTRCCESTSCAES
ncbi:Cadmium/zinc-transporting ATPase hma2 [Orobanche gracilis]